MRNRTTFIFKLVMGISLLAAAILWLLSVIPATAGAVSGIGPNGTAGHIAAIIVCAGWGLGFLLLGILGRTKQGGKEATPLRRMYIIFAIALWTIMVIVLVEVFAWAIPVMPIVAVGVAFGLLLAMIVVGGRRWDIAHNQEADSQPIRKETEWDKRKRVDAEHAASIAAAKQTDIAHKEAALAQKQADLAKMQAEVAQKQAEIDAKKE